ncbi:MAG: DUF2339 domain-containing protein [Betaproteobacteria bacterium]|nr:DUF2339 domain-containing protein [Betaproteobacteria bacterium]
MESWLFLGGLLGVFYLIVVPLIAFSALSRAGEARRQIAALQARLARFEAAEVSPKAAGALDHGLSASPAIHGGVSETNIIGAEGASDLWRGSPNFQVGVTHAAGEIAGKPREIPQAVAPSKPHELAQPAAVEKPQQEAQFSPAAPQPAPARAASPPLTAAPAKKVAQHDANPLSGLIGWLLKGNPLAKIGALLLFFGLSYLFKYSVDHALIPIELRLAGAGLLSLGFLAVGWRLRKRQPLYALILQGTAVGAFYLTAFAAFRLYALLPQQAVFALMIVICVASVVLSVLQRAQSLAVVAALGGYLAPVLLSTGGGSHIALFGYYAMLSAGILAVSVWQIWRPLNLVGFIFTFGVAALWGKDHYEPGFYLSCQLFLLLNFVIFGILAPLAALRQDSKSLRFVDGSLVFGTPLAAFGMQYFLMREQSWPFGAAFSCLALGVVYLPLARALMRRWPEAGKRMAVSFIALGGGFVTLAIPLALAARWTALAWALEGLGLVWVGLSQQHRRMAWSGTLLIALAAGSAFVAWPLDNVTMLLIFGVLALSSLGAGLFWSRRMALYNEAIPLSLALWLGGICAWLWWVFDGAERLFWLRLRPEDADYSMLAHLVWPRAMLAGLALSAVSACAWMFAGERLRWRLLRHSGWLLWPIAAGVLAALLARIQTPALSGFQACAWMLALVCAVLILKRTEPDLSTPQQKLSAHLGLCWITLVVCGTEVAWRIRELPWGWSALGPVIVLCALALAILVMRVLERRPWPVSANPRTYWILGLAPVLPLIIWALLTGNLFDGQLPGWHYLPLINPLEEAAAFALLMLCAWRLKTVRIYPAWRRPSALALAALSAWWLNGALVRALAFYGDIPWYFEALWDSRLIQTTLAIVWTCAALFIMALAQRRTSRPIWIGGASVLGVVIVKLFLVDSARGGGLARAVAFIGVAMLVFVIGYVAPLPPRKIKEPVHNLAASP